MFYVDSEGSCVAGDIFCVGSGATLAYAALDAIDIFPLTPFTSASEMSSKSSAKVLKDMPRDEAVEAAVAAVRAAVGRDGYSGGYVNVLVVDRDGCRHVHRVEALPSLLPDRPPS